jgi:hypothetical protein
MTFAASLLLAMLQAPPAASGQPLTVPPVTGTFRYSTLSLEDGIARFRSICLEPLLDPVAIERAVLASGLAFERSNEVPAGEWLWESRYGSVYFRSDSAMTDGRPMQDCNIRFVIPQRLAQRALADRIGRMLAPGRPRLDVDLDSIWNLGGDYADRIELGGWVPGDSRFISLNRRHIYPGQAQETRR